MKEKRQREEVKEERLKWQNRVEGGEHGEGASFLLPEGLGAGRDDPQ
jgi:hypothetical protein